MEINLGTASTGNISLKMGTLRRHMVCLGASGSGKTVACKVVCEEFIRNNVPVIAVDPQGDIASLIECEDPEITKSKGITQEMIAEYKKNAEVIIWTPASSVGAPLSLNPIGIVQSLQQNQNYEDVLRAISLAADSITGLLDYELSSDDGRLISGILNIALTFIYENDLDIEDFSGLAEFLAEPQDILLERTDPIASKNELIKLSKKLRLLTVGVKKLLFELGKPLNIEELLGIGNSKKTRLSVIYLNTLGTQEEKDFFLARLASSLYQWMIANPSEELQALFYIDEVAPFIPPVRKPACKDILKLLFKQARKYGVGCLIASQNPGDIDYTAISQCSTWNLGRLISRQDIKKVEKMIKSLSPVHADGIVEKLPSLGPGKFLLLAPDEFEDVVDLQVRWLITRHKTLDEEQIRELVCDKVRRYYTQQIPTGRRKTVTKEKTITEECSTQETEEIKIAPKIKKLPTDQQILELLKNDPTCFTINDIVSQLGINAATARKYLNSLEDKITRKKQGKSFLYWYNEYSFLPEYDLICRIDLARLQVLESEAIRLAERRLKKQLIFFEDEQIKEVHLHYLPLWQVHFTEELEKSFLFFKKIAQKRENIYFHALAGQICMYQRGKGFHFVETPKENPSVLTDLDDICTFESVFPGELDIDWGFWKDIISQKELCKRIARKFRIELHKIAMTFLPFWEFEIVDKDQNPSRKLALDGITGMPIEVKIS